MSIAFSVNKGSHAASDKRKTCNNIELDSKKIISLWVKIVPVILAPLWCFNIEETGVPWQKIKTLLNLIHINEGGLMPVNSIKLQPYNVSVLITDQIISSVSTDVQQSCTLNRKERYNPRGRSVQQLSLMHSHNAFTWVTELMRRCCVKWGCSWLGHSLINAEDVSTGKV